MSHPSRPIGGRTRAPGPVLVLGRAVVLGLVGLASGVASHVIGGGRLPGLVAMTALLVASVWASSFLVRTWASTRRLVLTVVVAQSLWHLVLSLLAGHDGDPSRTSLGGPVLLPEQAGGRRTGSLHDAFLASTAAAGPAPATDASSSGESFFAHQVTHLTAQGPSMVLAHLLGAVVLGLALARGEAALRGLVALLDRTVVAPGRATGLVVPPRPGHRRAFLTTVPAPRRSGRLALDSTRRRGPPYVLAA